MPTYIGIVGLGAADAAYPGQQERENRAVSTAHVSLWSQEAWQDFSYNHVVQVLGTQDSFQLLS